MPDTEDADLIQRFVASFERLDEMLSYDHSPAPEELSAGINPDDWDIWRPAQIDTPHDALSGLRERVGADLPHLYERLVLSYRWLEVVDGSLVHIVKDANVVANSEPKLRAR